DVLSPVRGTPRFHPHTRTGTDVRNEYRSMKSNRLSHPLQAVEDQVEPELELARIIGVRLCEVLLDVLGDAGVLVDWEVPEKRFGHAHELLLTVEGKGHLPERESGDVTVEGVVRVMCQVGREAGLSE